MSDPAKGLNPDRPALPRDAFRARRVTSENTVALVPQPVVVTPDYDDSAHVPAPRAEQTPAPLPTIAAMATKPPRAIKARADAARNPFDAYGERSSSRPYALRLPDAIDLVLRQIAAEERTHPLRVIDRILHDHLKRIGRLPPPRDA
ncbi:hypothetical protein PY365_18480 [Roseiarcaceae bacterium H3SJ34-1]|uniref:hypothetical protein n=1 Tax=Terripilifer ovatus TaxID=3032367 RepID=UPI003AB984A3|nr:hypothetical protein [Roseiarcaceae bacterium H3SJ34-1]